MTELLAETLPGGVLRLVFNRPAAANALNAAMQDALVAALDGAARDAAVRAVVLAGGRVFSAGADLREWAGEADAPARRRALLLRTLMALVAFPKPLVAAVAGKAIGGGVMLALLADEVLMTEGASLSMPEAALGMASPIGLAIIAARGGRGAAFRLVQAGEVLAGPAALALSLADALHAEDALMPAALARAAALGGPAFAANKAWMNAALARDLPAAALAAGDAHAH